MFSVTSTPFFAVPQVFVITELYVSTEKQLSSGSLIVQTLLNISDVNRSQVR